MTDETGTTENTWDKLDRLTEYKNGAGKIVKYEYNLANLPTKITYPNKEAVTRAYDKDDRLEKVTDWKSNATSFKYNKDSSSKRRPSLGTENEDTYGYNEADQMSEIHYKHGATSLGTLVYKRDGDGQVKKTTPPSYPGPPPAKTSYDENNRLIEAANKAYKYDKANNPTEIEGQTATNTTTPTSSPKARQPNTPTTKTANAPKPNPQTANPPPPTPTTRPATSPPSNAPKKAPSNQDRRQLHLRRHRPPPNPNHQRAPKPTSPGTPPKNSPSSSEDETNSYIYGPDNLPIEQIHRKRRTTSTSTTTNKAPPAYSPTPPAPPKPPTPTTPTANSKPPPAPPPHHSATTPNTPDRHRAHLPTRTHIRPHHSAIPHHRPSGRSDRKPIRLCRKRSAEPRGPNGEGLERLASKRENGGFRSRDPYCCRRYHGDTPGTALVAVPIAIASASATATSYAVDVGGSMRRKPGGLAKGA